MIIFLATISKYSLDLWHSMSVFKEFDLLGARMNSLIWFGSTFIYDPTENYEWWDLEKITTFELKFWLNLKRIFLFSLHFILDKKAPLLLHNPKEISSC